VVKSPGNIMLSEFGSAVDAVECAVKIQKEHKKEKDELPAFFSFLLFNLDFLSIVKIILY